MELETGVSDAAASQGMLRIASNYQMLGEKHGVDSSSASGGTNPADTLILDFWSPELWENKFLVF